MESTARKSQPSVHWFYNCFLLVTAFKFAESSEGCKTPVACGKGGRIITRWMDIPSCAGMSNETYDLDIKNIKDQIVHLQAEYQGYEENINLLLNRSNMPIYESIETPKATSEAKRCLIPVTCVQGSSAMPGWMRLEGEDLLGSKYTTEYRRLTDLLINLKKNYEGLIQRNFTDIDECEKSAYECHANATCLNTVGSYNCSCNDGFQGNGFNCSDECQNASTCAHINGSVCRNNFGSYTCDCKKGYEMNLNQTSCIDVNECEINEDKCHDNATCINTNGSYYCTCNDDFNCPDCDLYFDEICFWFLLEAVHEISKTEATNFCEKNSGSLAVLRSTDHIEVVNSYLRRKKLNGNSVWTGMLSGNNTSTIILPSGQNVDLETTCNNCINIVAHVLRDANVLVMRQRPDNGMHFGAICEPNNSG